MKKTFPLVSIIISNYNGVKLNILRDCLESFRHIDYPNYELILVDNASTDKSLKVAKKILGKNPKFKIIKNPVNMYSQGLDLGFSAARGEYIAYFNNDLAIEKRYFHKLIEAFNKYSRLALVQGKLLWYFDHQIIDSAGETMDIFGNPVTIGNKIKDDGQFDRNEEILSASGSACMLKRSIFKDIGQYDPYYGIGYEDMDLALRLRYKGFIVMRIPSAICYHKRGTTDLSAMVRIRVKWHFNKNRLATMIKNYPLSTLLEALPVTLFIYMGIMIYDAFVKRNLDLSLTRPSSVFWVLKNLPRIIEERRKIRKDANFSGDRKTFSLFASPNLFQKFSALILQK
ncbi:hypothetical protein A3D00_00150 [Candidatus Woesebacteria bacterium RIFCSPHIGHO2_02_FULL_38_9]|nr:MAG: hypothetical protein A3D00_00150 [Candidatus Woesebacteria bacterium RIFCSPHIGHO2_02_FULL_38_9]OGM57853.1 MAG: hypothetical protein A3A50_02460 [Candidatus Woesebacteria bacterium RIFCSPLOWO2_01_FULL_38_20]